jgi:hypothetical protein
MYTRRRKTKQKQSRELVRYGLQDEDKQNKNNAGVGFRV